MNSTLKLPLLLLSVSLLTGCYSMQRMGEQERAGTVLGAIGGGLIGGAFGHGAGHLVGAGVGAVIGGVLGNALGESFDDADYYAARSNYFMKNTYPNPSGRCTSNCKTNRSDYGYYCREYASSQYFYGCSRQNVYGVACRHPNGPWYRY